QLVARLGGFLAQISDPAGNLPRSFADPLRLTPSDSGPANAQRLLSALDTIAALHPRAWEPTLHPHAQAYFRSLRRAANDRRLLFESRPSPSPSAGGNRSVSLIHPVPLPDRSLFPAHLGLFKPVDAAAIRAIRRHVDDSVLLRPIPAAESERRGGAIHCSLS